MGHLRQPVALLRARRGVAGGQSFRGEAPPSHKGTKERKAIFVQGPQRGHVPGRELIPDWVESHAALQGMLRAHPIDRPLHLPMTAVPPFHRIRGGRQLRVVEKRRGLVDVGAEKLVEGLPHALEAAHALA